MSMVPDFSCWFYITATKAQAELGTTRVFRGCLGGPFEPLSPPLEPQPGGAVGAVGNVNTQAAFLAASADHSHFFFRPVRPNASDKAIYISGDPVPDGSAALQNPYVASLGPAGEPRLELLARGRDDKEGKVKAWGGNCGAVVGGPGMRNQGAVAPDGSRTYLTTRPNQPATGACTETSRLRILERLETAAGPLIRELFPSVPGVGDDRFQGASADQSKVYFTSNRQLAGSDLDAGADCSAAIGASTACDLYLYASDEPAGERLIQVSAGEDVAGEHEAGKEAKVLDGTVAISGDGTHVYFAAEGALTDDLSPEGRSAADFSSSVPKLYLYRRDVARPAGELSFVGPLDPSDSLSGIALWGGAGTFANSAFPAPAGGDGHVLFFVSSSALTADDDDGTRRDLYRYDAAADTLERVSASAPGGSDNGPFDIARRGFQFDPQGTELSQAGRWVSEDGAVAVFSTAEGLARGDGNGDTDNYMWRRGSLSRLPGAGERPAVSSDGATVAFSTTRQLLPQDGDGAEDVYVARVGGGFLIPDPVPICQPDRAAPGPHCRDEAPPPLPGPDSRSATAPSAGNVKSGARPRPRRCAKGKRRVVRKKKVRCVKSKRAKKSRQARSNRRAAK
jgi:hypothetical protein